MKAIKRLSQFIEMKGMNLKEFEESCGLSYGYMSKNLARGSAIGSDMLEKIATAHPDLNMNWLITGKGYMIVNPAKSSYKKDEIATQRLEEEQAIYNTKNEAAELIQEGLDKLSSALKKEKANRRKN